MASLYPKSVQDLIDLFSHLPGVGPRQATRFVFYLLRNNTSLIPAMKNALEKAESSVMFCDSCYRTTEKKKESPFCSLCRDEKRDPTIIAVVEKESDLQNIEKIGAFSGRYHVLGGVISALDPDSPRVLHLKELHARVTGILEKSKTAEVILATSSTAEGDMTGLYIERVLTPLKTQFASFRVTRLGRGLSAGAELEYADGETLKNAFGNRK